MQGTVESIEFHNGKPAAVVVVAGKSFNDIDVDFDTDGAGYWHCSGGGPWTQQITGTQTFAEFVAQYSLAECDSMVYCAVCEGMHCTDYGDECDHLFIDPETGEWQGIGTVRDQHERKAQRNRFLSVLKKKKIVDEVYAALIRHDYVTFGFCRVLLFSRWIEFEEYSEEEFLLDWFRQAYNFDEARDMVVGWIEAEFFV